MLMENDKKVLKNLLPEMAKIVNLIPGEVFSCKDADALLIMQRKMADSDIKKELQVFNEIFSKQKGASISEITNSLIAYVKIKVLLEEGMENFDGHSYRELYKECNKQIVRTNNIVKLTNTSALTAADYQKENIELVLRKNNSFLVALSNLMESVEKRLERLPKEEEKIATDTIEAVTHVTAPKEKKKSFSDKFSDWKMQRANKKEKEAFLKREEEKQSKTSCAEIPFYDRSITFTEKMICRDIPRFCIFKRKDNVFFGRTCNVSGNRYDNSDESLIELTKASDEFIQFMTEDVLSDEYELKVFSEKEKRGMRMYFDFMNRCFEKYIGVVLTVSEYLSFKHYYNCLVLKMLELEKNKKEDYYKALILADCYLSYMEGYDLKCADDEETIIDNIVKEKYGNYIDDINLIIHNHIVDENARADLENVIDRLVHFHADKSIVKSEELPEIAKPDVPMMPIAPVSVNQGVTQIVIQILNQNYEIVDEALYAGNNIVQALFDYQKKSGFIKRLGFRNNGQDVFYQEEKEEMI